MYLDWLSTKHHSNDNLNWYQYEISINSSEKDYLKRCLENLTGNSSLNNKSNATNVSYHQVRLINNKPQSMNSSTQASHQKQTPLISNLNYPSNSFLPKMNVKHTTYKEKEFSSSPNFALSNNSSIFNLKFNAMNHPERFELPSLSKQRLLANGAANSKGVKFETDKVTSSYLANNNESYTNRGSPQPNNNKKPILKQQLQGYNGNNNNNNTASNLSDKSSSDVRRSSIMSGYSSEKNSLGSAKGSKKSAGVAHVKLPPIGRCSDDFYAVLSDLEGLLKPDSN